MVDEITAPEEYKPPAHMQSLVEEVLIPAWKTERERQTKFEDWARGRHEPPYKPDENMPEFNALMEKAKVPLIGAVIRVLRQAFQVTNYIPGEGVSRDDLWKIWVRNRMVGRQNRIWEPALIGGLSYTVTTLDAFGQVDIKVFSGKNMIALYEDPEADEWPTVAAYSEKKNDKEWFFTVIDSTHFHTYSMGHEGSEPKHFESRAHNTPGGLVPVVRYHGEMDSEGNVRGEVEALIPVQMAVDQAKFDLLLAQTYGSWKVRYATGVEEPESDEEQRRTKVQLSHDRILTSSNPDTKFGTLDGTDLLGYIEAGKASKQELATISQIPSKSIVGAQANTASGAEAQAADESSMLRKIHDYTTSFGESIAQQNRLNGLLAGIEGAWEDYGGTAEWRDASIRSLAQVADAVQKLSAESLQIPKEALWEMLPDIGPETTAKWKELAQSDPLLQLLKGTREDA
ncbi:hypothetical protein M2390_002934 [Mycetocola sp. BIGb0189]|uniref:phage portal protein n=1 Tax=Mycetocola sp. BIGb0189 TaxID=2940604 RepID=UPI002169A658|nr:phage portal protein [Mycetocola sp. BIGb0189]MCS4277725.1 hypothetical protein [Mycetocola sp. BIGb0189]